MKGNVIKYDKDNIDTDVILPGTYLKLHDYDELAKHAMEGLDPDFHSKIKDGDFIVAGRNFGCGSSREHAVWALKDYGFFVIIAPSFADIFYSNCFKNGLLPIKLDSKTVDSLFQTNHEIEVDLETQKITTPTKTISFEIDEHRKQILLKGLDDIAMTLEYEAEISDYEKQATIPSLL